MLDFNDFFHIYPSIPEAKKEIKLPNGLQNLGNTCYMNSVIQSFKVVFLFVQFSLGIA